MALNLHALVRGAVQSINRDTFGWWYRSNGNLQSATGDGRQVPAYLAPIPVKLQVQPPSGKDLQFIDYLQLQGVIRTVFMFGLPQGIVRVNQLGGDLLLFPQRRGAPNDVWKIEQPAESWDVDDCGWTKLFAVLQTDRLYSSMNVQGQLVLDSEGRIEATAS